MDKKSAKRLIKSHPSDYLMFGTDSPWTDQKNAVKLFKSLNLNKELCDKILFKNALRILGE